MSQPAAILVGLDNITGLQSSRLLHARNVDVIGIAEDPRHFACKTRSCTRVIAGPTTGEALIEVLERLAGDFAQPPVLIPCTDQAVLAISRFRARLEERFRFVLPPADVVEMLVDKARFAEFATANDIAVPPTAILTDRPAAEAAARRLRFPVIVKPAVKSDGWKARTSAKGFVVDDPAALLARYDESRAWTDALVAQELIPGGASNHYTANLYFDRSGAPLVSLVTRKLRQWPPGTGTGSLGEQCDNPEVLKESLKLFGSVEYRGLAYVEMKLDERTGSYVVIEPNIGRPTGRSATATAAGVELLYTAYADAAGLPIPAGTITRPGVKWIYLRQDAQSSIAAARRGNLGLRQWVRSVRGVRVFAVFAVRDPAPFLWDFLHVMRKTMAAARRRILRRARPAPD